VRPCWPGVCIPGRPDHLPAGCLEAHAQPACQKIKKDFMPAARAVHLSSKWHHNPPTPRKERLKKKKSALISRVNRLAVGAHQLRFGRMSRLPRTVLHRSHRPLFLFRPPSRTELSIPIPLAAPCVGSANGLFSRRGQARSHPPWRCCLSSPTPAPPTLDPHLLRRTAQFSKRWLDTGPGARLCATRKKKITEHAPSAKTTALGTAGTCDGWDKDSTI
jgi:hypothetical protein